MKKVMVFLAFIALAVMAAGNVRIAKADTGSFQFIGNALPSGQLGYAYSAKVSFLYSGNYAADIAANVVGLPTGITLDSEIQPSNTTGLYYVSLDGNASAAGQYTLTVVLTDQSGASASQAYSLSIGTTQTAFTITTTSLPPANLAAIYNQNISFTYMGNGIPQSFVSGLPVGITAGSAVASGSAGYVVPLTGLPSGIGQFTVTVSLTDGGQQLAKAYPFAVTTNPSTGGFTFDTQVVPVGITGQPYSTDVAFEYLGRDTPQLSVTGLPAGISYDLASVGDSSVHLSGTPTQAGSFNVIMNLSGNMGTASHSYSLIVEGGAGGTAAPTPTPAVNSSPTPSMAHPAGTNVSSNGTVYMVTADGQLRPYTSAGAFLSYGFNTWATVTFANSADLALPQGSFIPPRDGKIICSNKGSDTGTCYLITDSQKAAFTSAMVFKGLGFSFSNTLNGDVSFLPSAQNIASATQAHPAGVLVNKGGTIYLVGDTGLLGVPDVSTLTSWGYSLGDAVKANAADSALVQTGVMATHTAGALSPFGN